MIRVRIRPFSEKEVNVTRKQFSSYEKTFLMQHNKHFMRKLELRGIIKFIAEE